jgi:putative salt-induced outer membrane protein YdiY
MALSAILASVVANNALADVVYMNNGDRLTGVVVSAGGGVLVFKSPSVGEVKIPLSDVATFTTDQPIQVHLNDGTVLAQPVAAGEPGRIATAGAGPVQGKDIPLTSIKTVNPPPVKWTGSVTAGVMLTRGNTYTDSANAGFDAVRRAEEDRLTLKAAYNYSREKPSGEEARVSQENWMAGVKYDYFVSEKWFLYGNGRVERDHIANLDLRLTPGAGVGYQWIESAKTNFNTEGGLTWVYERYTDPDSTRDYLAARLAYHLDHQLSENVKFIHNVEVLPSLEEFGEFLLTADAGLRANLTKSFFSEAKVVYQYNSQPAEGKDKSDIRYIMSLGWGF